MAHYAIIDENNIVIDVFVGRDENDPLDPADGVSSWEEYYGAIRTSYNTLQGKHLNGGVPFRKNYACIGFTYDSDRDAFIPPKPFDSWTLDEDKCVWVPPFPAPDDDKIYEWDDENTTWVEVPADPE